MMKLTQSSSFCRNADKACIKRSIVCYQHRIFAEFQKFRKNILNGRRVFYHIVGDPCQFCDFRGNGTLGIDENTETVNDFPVCYLYSTNFRNHFFFLGKARGFNIEYHIGIIQILSSGGEYCIAQVINEVGFHAINNFQIRFICRIHGIREGLYHTMVSDGNGFMSPINGTFDISFHRCHAVHTAHLCMEMEFHTFFLCRIHTRRRSLCRHDGFCHDVDFFGVFIKLHFPLHPEVSVFFDFIFQFVVENRPFHKEFYRCGIGLICNIKRNNVFFPFDFSGFDIENIPLHNDRFPGNFRIYNLHRGTSKFFAKEDASGNGFADRSHFRRNFRLFCRLCSRSNLLKEFLCFCPLFLFHTGTVFLTALDIFELHGHSQSCFFLHQFCHSIIQFFLGQIISHVMLNKNLHLAILIIPVRIGNNAAANFALGCHMVTDGIPELCQNRLGFFIHQLIFRENMHLLDTWKLLHHFFSQFFPVQRRNDFICRNLCYNFPLLPVDSQGKHRRFPKHFLQRGGK